MQQTRTKSRETTILVADDSEVVREHLTELLDALPRVSVVAVSDSVEATLAAVDEHAPDLLVLDFQLPDGNATDVLATLSRGFGEAPEVLVLTNFADPVTRAQVLKAGASEFFDKSKQFMDLVGRVSEIASRP